MKKNMEQHNKKNHTKQKKAIISSLIGTVITSGVAVSVPLASKQNSNFIGNSQANIEKVVDQFANAQAEKNPIVPVDQFYQNPILVEKTGPIVSYGNKITALDWFAGKRWEFDFGSQENIKEYMPNGTNSGMWHWNNRNFISWSLDTQRNLLWLLTSATTTDSKNVPDQNLIGINSIDGSVKYHMPVTRPKNNPHGIYDSFQQIAALKSGKVLVYSGGNKNIWGHSYLCDPVTKTVVFNDISKDSETLKLADTMVKKGERRWQYLIPIADNINIAILQDLDASYNKSGTNNLYMMLVDDNMHARKTNCNEFNNKLYEIKNNWPDTVTTQGSANIYNKSYFYTLDNRVYYTAYNKFFVFKIENNDIKVKILDLKDKERISSFAMDVNENIFYKLYDDSKIYKLIINSPTNNFENTTFDSATYYDIKSYSNPSDSDAEEVRKSANDFIIYNVSEYSGSLMMLKARKIIEGKYLANPPENSTHKYGLALAITPNQNDPKIGDSKGVLNGANSFQTSADFTISNNILNSKIPSEITENDLTLLNGGFLTQNKTMENNQLKYKPFEISNIDDTTGKFTITANLDQIPWFTNSLPSSSVPKKISKEFTTTNKIENKVSWKQNADNDYDFKNTLPSKVNENDLNEFDPLQISFNSKVVLDSKGNPLYPKKSYKVTKQNDTDGKITIEATYKYLPMGRVYENENSLLTYTSSHEYQIFSKSQTPAFYFAGATSEASSTSLNPIDVRKVPELKALSQANVLPSSFLNMDKSNFIQFINTNKSIGYPISRMNFEIEADDQMGTITIIAKMEQGYYGDSNNKTIFKQTYTGLNKIVSYNFSFKNTASTINGTPFASILPSAINEGDVIKNLITYQGFNSTDFKIILFPKNDEGKLLIEVQLSDKYTSKLGNSNGFDNYKASFEFSGFMTTEMHNKQYSIEFVSNDDIKLMPLKKLTTSNIYDSLVGTSDKTSPKGLMIDNRLYKNLNDLVQHFLINYTGSNLPQDDWSNNPNVTTKMTYNNNAGTMNILLTIKQAALKNMESDLNMVISYDGFAKGNMEVTSDNLSFIDNDMIKNVLETLKINDVETLKTYLLESPEHLKQIISNVSGVYETLINSNKYKLDIETNKAYNTITITLSFDRNDVPDNKSLTTYSIQYKL